MNAKSILALSALALFGAGHAIAAEGTQDFADAKALSSAGRADVVAQIHGAPASLIGEASIAPAALSTLPRMRVVAEAREAQRLGLIGPSESTPLPTAAQLEQIRVAGEASVADRMASAK